MHIETVGAARGLDWITEGFALFRKNPLIWIVNFIIALAIVTLLSLIPVIGSIATMLLQPVLLGGLLLGCRSLRKGEDLRIEHLFDGFRQSTKPLLMVGLYSGLAYLAVALVAALIIGGGAISVGILGEVSDSPELASGAAAVGTLVVVLVSALMALPIAMATWFAPSLVLFRGLAPLEALKASFFACLRNWLPFLVYGLAMLVLVVIAIIPAGLGLLILGPTGIGTVYVGYLDIFGNGE
jgi:uncharacterized membrane protein